MEFIKSNLSSIASQIKTGKTPPTKVAEYFGGDINWYTPVDLSKSIYLTNSNRTITKKAIQDKKAVIFKKNTVLISCIGDIGKLGIISVNSSSNQQITGLELNKNISPLFFYFWCKKNKKLFEKNARNAVVPILNNAVLSKINITYPKNYKDQIRIASILSRAENLIAKRKESIELLDELLKSTFLEMFGNPVKNEMGWEKKPLNKLGLINRGVSKNRPRNAPQLLGGRYPLIQTGDITKAGIYITKYYQTYSEIGFKQSKLWEAGTLCITIAANIAKTGILAFDACFPDSVVGFIANSDESNTIYVHFLFIFFQKILEKNAPQAAQKNINLGILRNLIVPCPPLPLQNKFAQIVEKVESIKSKYKQSLTELENLYGALSQRAFKGELDLSKIPIKKDIEIKAGRVGFATSVKADFKVQKLFSKQELLSIIKSKNGNPFNFNELWDDLEKADFIEMPAYDEIKGMVFMILEDKEPILSQSLDEDGKEIVLKGI